MDKKMEKEHGDVPVSHKREYNFLSHSTVGKSYTVTQEGQNYKCDCPGFHFKKKCRHIQKAKKMSKKPLQAMITEYPPSPPGWL